MIRKYFDFVNESLELILESDVVFSKKFRLALSKMENPLAKSILSIENEDLPVASNYFDISKDKNDSLSFIPDRKAQEILGDTKENVRFIGSGGGWLRHSESNANIFKDLGYEPEGSAYQPNSSEVGEVVSKVTGKSSGKIWVYVKFPNGKGVFNQDKLQAFDQRQNEVWSKNRQEVKIGRAIRALLKTAGVEALDKDIEVFVNQYKATIDKMNDIFQYFDVVDGEEIGNWYHYNTYYNRSGTLGSSCMSNVSTRYFDIYITNKDVCKLVILKSTEDESKIVARALLWKLRNGKQFMDRIYTINDSDVNLFRDYAKENGWYSKYYNSSSDDSQAYAPDGSTIQLDLIVDIRKGDYNGYPYLDTVKYFNPNSGTLSNEKDDDDYTLENTDGTAQGECSTCDGEGRVDCYECDGSGRVDCNECDGNGDAECNDCEGSGNEECSTCDGEGSTTDDEGNEVNCKDCDGDGKNDCGNCDGHGRVNCGKCGGDCDQECYNCDGEGRVDCRECN